jgi:sigma-B regulation protein RsbU (phosphoserine phosphatase)
VKLKKLGAEAIGIGTSFLVLAVTNDILGYLNILHTKRLIAEGLILFTISMSVAMALKYAKLYDALQAAQKELVEKEKMEHEIKLAANVQRSLLPVNLPEDANFSVDAYLEPARMVGGDFYDVIRIDNEHLGLLVADVADKGIHAAMSMAVTRTLFFTESRRSRSPAQVANAVHKYIMDVMPTNDIFITAFYGVLHCPTGLLTYVRAGHEKPLLYRPGQPVNALESNGRFLGMIDQLDIEEYTFQLQPGDRLILYSDGLTDATNISGDMFGSLRFIECLGKNGSLPAAKLVRKIIDTTSAWSQGATQFDDLTLLVVEAK